MTEWERVTDSFSKLAEACNEATKAVADWACSVIKTFCETLDFEFIIKASAYIQAQKEHPEWVHKATYCKKKRIRKKYHDRIMRQYWRVNDGN